MGQHQRSRRRCQVCCSETLAPLLEGPDLDDLIDSRSRKESSWDFLRSRFRTYIDKRGSLSSSTIAADPKLLLSVLGCPLAPLPISYEQPLAHISIKDTPYKASSAHYIIKQYLAATGLGSKTQTSYNKISSMYAVGSVEMVACETEMAGKISKNHSTNRSLESGCFVLWQMSPDMWSMELVLSGIQILAASNGKIVWRQTPWLGTNAAKGPPRPLGRFIQGLDPKSTASLFGNAQCHGEKRIGVDDCFILKVSADQAMLAERSDGPAEVIRHVLYGYFSQKSGLLVYMEDSHLTRVESSTTSDTVYWETTIATNIYDYKKVDGMLIAHSGRSVATVFRFGESSMKHSRVRLEERWSIEDIVLNVHGLSADTFLPPADITC